MLYAKIINYCIFNIHQQKELLQDNLLRLFRLLSEHDFNLLGAIKLQKNKDTFKELSFMRSRFARKGIKL